jgi:hypothetical protein
MKIFPTSTFTCKVCRNELPIERRTNLDGLYICNTCPIDQEVTTTLSKLQLADIVCLGKSAYSHATVCQIDKDFIYFFRPYTHTADFSCTSGVICYTGVEHFQRYLSDIEPIILVRRPRPLL